MDIRNRRVIRQSAAQAVASASPDTKKLVLVYTGITCLLSLISAFISFYLSDQIADTGGLSSMGLRSILTTIQSVLPVVQLIVTVCLNLGYHICVLKISRGKDAAPRTLLGGFRNFAPLLRTVLLQAVVYFALGMGVMYLSSFIFAATPLAEPFYELMEPYLASTSALSGELVIDDSLLLAAMDTIVPMLWIFLGLFLLLFIPIAYQFRMVTFCLADDPRAGAFAALRKSTRLMRRNRFKLFLLDLSMWWFYAAQLFLTAVCYGDVLLEMAGISLPWSSTVSYYLFYILAMVLQITVYYFVLNRVYVSYAVAYDTLQQPEEPQPPKAQDLPFPTEY